MALLSSSSAGVLAIEDLPDGSRMLHLEGVLDFNTVPALNAHATGAFDGHEHIVVDMGRVSNSNSAGLALLLEWCRLARRGGARFQVRHLPGTLRNIARLCELEQLLPEAAP